MDEEKFNGLLEYLDRLTRLNQGNYICNEEITECVKEIRIELGFEKLIN